jgi:hypothetical protein
MAPRVQPRSGQVRTTQEPQTAAAPAIQATPTPPLRVVGLQGVGATMISSLPSIASGADVYSRQFYRPPRLPYRRYLPVRNQ